ncbi:MAG: hypothetical protein M5U28_45655 [Sandaracinaceae bacterium]|nr:hypothetical protein [Sandaracinaceae bacterium]
MSRNTRISEPPALRSSATSELEIFFRRGAMARMKARAGSRTCAS